MWIASRGSIVEGVTVFFITSSDARTHRREWNAWYRIN